MDRIWIWIGLIQIRTSLVAAHDPVWAVTSDDPGRGYKRPVIPLPPEPAGG